MSKGYFPAPKRGTKAPTQKMVAHKKGKPIGKASVPGKRITHKGSGPRKAMMNKR